MPKISVIVPVYKVEPYLRKCVDSILAQTFQDFELILVDDGSPDQCGAICEEYAREHENVIALHRENGGLSAARNTGIDWAFANSDSEWLTYVDSDDWIKPEFLQVLYQTAVREKADLVMCDFEPFDEQGQSIDPKHDFSAEVIWDKNRIFRLLYSNWRMSPAWCKLYHKSIFKDLRYDVGKLHEDEFIIHKLFWRAASVAICPESLYCYLIRRNSITGLRSARLELDSLEAHINRYWFCRERKLPIDPRLFKKQYVAQILGADYPEEPAAAQRNEELKKAYTRILLKQQKIVGAYKLIDFNIRKNKRKEK